MQNLDLPRISRCGSLACGVLLLAAMPLMNTVDASLQAPKGRVVIAVDGNISATNDGATARFDRAMLEAIGTTRIRTRTPWTDRPIEFEGVLVRDFLRAVGASSNSFRVVAHDDYEAHVTGIDFDKYPAILAMKMDGKTMRLRDKGPLWLIFPWDDYPELHELVNSGLSVWQIKRVTVD